MKIKTSELIGASMDGECAAEIHRLGAKLAEAVEQRDIAIWMLAGWCVDVDQNGTGWDDWDENYKDAMYRPNPLRELLDKAIAEEIALRNGEDQP